MNSSDSNHIAIRLALTLGFDSKPGRFAPDGQLRFGATGSGRCLRADAPGEVGSDQSIQARLSAAICKPEALLMGWSAAFTEPTGRL